MSHTVRVDPAIINVTDAACVNLTPATETGQTAVMIQKPDGFTGDCYFELRKALSTDKAAGNPPADVAAVRAGGKYAGTWPLTVNVDGKTNVWCTIGAGQGNVDLKITSMCQGSSQG